MYVPLDTSTKSSWNDSTLILPCVSVGNVAQLAADLLISSLHLVKVGRLNSDCVLPVIGNDPYSEKVDLCTLMTAIEVFESADKQLVLIQQRSPVISGKRHQFVEKLLDWVKESKFRDIVIITSSHAHERLDSQLTGCQLRYLSCPQVSAEFENLTLSSGETVSELEKRNPLHLDLQHPTSTEPNSEDLIFIPGGGIAKTLYSKCLKEGLRAGVLLEFCSEGDNIPESVLLAAATLSLLHKLQPSVSAPGDMKWKMPPSWQLMYGSQCNQILFR